MAESISEETARYVVSEEGQERLAELGTATVDGAGQVLMLRKRGVALEVAGALVDVVAARKRARGRFGDADKLFFTGEALAQASSLGVSRYHAGCLSGGDPLLEIGCGVGMDTTVLAQASRLVTAVERDAARLVFARANAEVRGVSDRIEWVQADATDALPDLSRMQGLYVDPSRREGDRRTSQNAARYDPSLEQIAEWARQVPGGCVKLSPALPDDVLDDFAASIKGRIEFLSENRECKEACVLWGTARGEGGDLPRAAVLRLWYPVAAGKDAPIAPTLPQPGQFALDPDPALIRADALGAIPDAFLLSPDDAYLTSETIPPPEFASAYHIDAIMPYQPRRVGAWIKDAGYGRIVVKKRHFPREPDALARELGVSGKGPEITLILVRTGASHLALLCQPCPSSSTLVTPAN